MTVSPSEKSEINSERWQLLPETAIDGFTIKQNSRITVINLQQNQQKTKAINNIHASLKT